MLRDIRKEYLSAGLNRADLPANPFDLFRIWLDQAIKGGQGETTAMTVATCDATGCPDARVVLLKELTDEGFVFFTNYQSVKGRQLEHNTKAALVFFWPACERQVRIRGTVRKTNDKQSVDYFQTRPRDSRIGAWASNQSMEINNRQELEQQFLHYKQLFEGKEITKPANWGGYIVLPEVFEFWQGRINRLHDRFRYLHNDGCWTITRLQP